MKIPKTLTALLTGTVILATSFKEPARDVTSIFQDPITCELEQRAAYSTTENNPETTSLNYQGDNNPSQFILNNQTFDANKLVDAIIQHESGGDPMALSNRHAWGLMQIRAIVLKEYREDHPEDYIFFSDLLNPDINRKLGTWYLNKLATEYLPNMNLPVTVDNLILAYNEGLRFLEVNRDASRNPNVPQETRKYIRTINQALGI